MSCISVLWRRLTQKALEQSTGKLETYYFESAYRIVYASGLDLSDQQTVFYRIYSFIIKVSIALFITAELWYLFNAKSLDTVIDNINVLTIHLLIAYRYKNLIEYKRIYHKLAKSMEVPLFDISTPARKNIFEHWKNNNMKYYYHLLVLASFTLSLWYTYPLFEREEYNLPARVWIPYDYKNPELYGITYAIVLLCFHYTSAFVVVNDLLIQVYLIHMICQFEVLSNCFATVASDCQDANDEIFRQKFHKRLGDLVAQHQFLLNNSLELGKILSRPMLCQLIASGMLICLAGYQVVVAAAKLIQFVMFLLYLSYNLYLFFLLCRWCDEIKSQSVNIGQSVYTCGWESVVARLPEARTRLLVIMARCQLPVTMTAGGIYDVSLESYSRLVKTSYSALTVLLRVQRH